MTPFIGQIMSFGGNFAPRGWAFCDGQLLAISQNTALFSILGTTYGGDGRTSFGLPELRGRFPLHPGNGPGLTPKRLGEKGGAERVTPIKVQLSSKKKENSSEDYAASSKETYNMQPYTVVNYIIALNGIYPSRS